MFPKTTVESAKKRASRKITPVVAIADDFIEYQRRLENEKQEKEKKKIEKRKKKTEANPLVKRKDTKDDKITQEKTKEDKSETESDKVNKFHLNDFVIFKYEGNYFPGQIQEIESDVLLIKSMEKLGIHWRWPNREDVIWYRFSDVVSNIKPPGLMNKRGIYLVPEMEHYKNIILK